MIFMIRRFALVIVVTIGRFHLWLQMTTMVVSSVIQVAYLTNWQPSAEKLLLKLDIFNEWTTVILVDSLLIFSAGNLTKFDLEADCFFLACLFGNLCVHLFFLIKSSVVGAKEGCKKRKKKGKSCCPCDISKMVEKAHKSEKDEVFEKRPRQLYNKKVKEEGPSKKSHLSVIKEIEGDFDDFENEFKKKPSGKMKLPMDADAEYIEKKRPRRIIRKPRKQEEFKSAVREALADISDLSLS